PPQAALVPYTTLFRSTKGKRVGTQYRDRKGNNINPAMFSSELGDRQGSLSNQSGASITSAESFRSWFRDDPRYNLSMTVTELRRSEEHTSELQSREKL